MENWFFTLKNALLPSNAKKLKHDFNLSNKDLKLACLPHLTAQEPYVKSFQYKVLNSILNTNTKTPKHQNFLKLDISNMTNVLFAELKQKHYTTFSSLPTLKSVLEKS